MQAENTPEASANRVFTYRNPSLLITAIYSLFFSIALLAVLFDGLIPSAPPDPLIWCLLVFFTAAALVILAAGIIFLLAYLFEKVIVSGNEVRWIDRFGRQRLRFTFDDIESVFQRQLSGPAAGHSSKLHNKCMVLTKNGKLVFSDNLRGFRQLEQLLAPGQEISSTESLSGA